MRIEFKLQGSNVMGIMLLQRSSTAIKTVQNIWARWPTDYKGKVKQDYISPGALAPN